MIYQIYKYLGETPLEALRHLREREDPSGHYSWTYAGRLDPMAEGWMYVLSGDDVYRKDEFTDRDKVYEVEVLWGIGTDSYDLLGLPQHITGMSPPRAEIAKKLARWQTTFDQPYPPFSAKTVHGKPLWQWAREGKLERIVVPRKEVTIRAIKHIDDRTINTDDLLQTVNERCALATQDFRQDEVLQAWKYVLGGPTAKYVVTAIRVRCSAGTYMRSLAHDLGEQLGCGACAFSIHRMNVG